MQAHHLWWIAAALAVAAELASGTFVLLMAALGLAAGAIAAQAGAPLSLQLLVAALVGGGAVAVWALQRRPTAAADLDADPELHLDIGQPVHVEHWAADGSTRVHHRGSEWSARWDAGSGPRPDAPADCVIRALRGNVLMLGR